MNIAPTLIIEDDLLIRMPRETDINERFVLGRSLEFRKMVGGSVVNVPIYKLEDAAKLYEKEMKNKYSWFIEYKGKMIGVCRLRRQQTGSIRYSIGIYNDSLFSLGIGTKVTRAVSNFAFDTLKLDKLELMVLVYNKRGIRCYEKCGYKVTSILKDNIEIDGIKHDDYIMEMSNSFSR